MKDGLEPVQTILCALDFSPFSAVTAKEAVRLAEALEAKVFFLHVLNRSLFDEVERLGGRLQVFDGAIDDAISGAQDERAQRLAELLDQAGAGRVAHESWVAFGVPWEKILEHAERREAGLIVMGAKGRGSLVRSLRFGSSAEKVFRRAQCRTLFVR
jgi:nucleotide-binding universal stress UspA family protein